MLAPKAKEQENKQLPPEFRLRNKLILISEDSGRLDAVAVFGIVIRTETMSHPVRVPGDFRVDGQFHESLLVIVRVCASRDVFIIVARPDAKPRCRTFWKRYVADTALLCDFWPDHDKRVLIVQANGVPT